MADADRVLQLAAAQRMNTDVRRSLFCVIMTADDCVDAFEKILRLGLSGKQVRGRASEGRNGGCSFIVHAFASLPRLPSHLLVRFS